MHMQNSVMKMKVIVPRLTTYSCLSTYGMHSRDSRNRPRYKQWAVEGQRWMRREGIEDIGGVDGHMACTTARLKSGHKPVSGKGSPHAHLSKTIFDIDLAAHPHKATMCASFIPEATAGPSPVMQLIQFARVSAVLTNGSLVFTLGEH